MATSCASGRSGGRPFCCRIALMPTYVCISAFTSGVHAVNTARETTASTARTGSAHARRMRGLIIRPAPLLPSNSAALPESEREKNLRAAICVNRPRPSPTASLLPPALTLPARARAPGSDAPLDAAPQIGWQVDRSCSGVTPAHGGPRLPYTSRRAVQNPPDQTFTLICRVELMKLPISRPGLKRNGRSQIQGPAVRLYGLCRTASSSSWRVRHPRPSGSSSRRRSSSPRSD